MALIGEFAEPAAHLGCDRGDSSKRGRDDAARVAALRGSSPGSSGRLSSPRDGGVRIYARIKPIDELRVVERTSSDAVVNTRRS